MFRRSPSPPLSLVVLTLLACSSGQVEAEDVFATIGAVLTNGTTATEPILAIGDFNGDGLNDVAWQHQSTLRVAPGRGDGSFAPQVVYGTGVAELGPEMAVGDLNGDGFPDTIHGRGPGQQLGAVLLTNGVGGLDATVLDLQRPHGTWPMLGDADMDGDLDIYFVEVGLTIFRNDGDGTFVNHTDFLARATQRRKSFTLGDLDGDGRADVVSTALDGDHSGLDLIFIGPDPTRGDLPGITRINTQAHGLGTDILVELADMENDGDLDIYLHGASAQTGVASIQVIRNDGERQFTTLPMVSSTDRYLGAGADMLLTDLDGDGFTDLVLGCTESDCRLLVLHHGHAGGVGPMEFLPVMTASDRLLAADLDCDGDPEIIGGSGTGVSVIINRGSRTYEDQLFVGLSGEDLALGDLDGDGGLDIAALGSGGIPTALGRVCGVADLRACSGLRPVSDPGDDVSFCGPPNGVTLAALSGSASLGNPGIKRYCWKTDLGFFVESGMALHCSESPTATLEVPNVEGRRTAAVQLTTTLTTGCDDTSTVLVVTEAEPVITLARPVAGTICLGAVADFLAQATDTFSGEGLVTMEWDFDINRDTNGNGQRDDDVDASVTAVSSQIGVASHVYRFSAGQKTARLRVRSEAGVCVATRDVVINVTVAPVIGSITTSPRFACPGKSINFRASASDAGEEAVFIWDFDTSVDADGNGDPADDNQAVGRGGSGANAVLWSYPVGGVYTIRAMVIGAGGCTSYRDQAMTVFDGPEAFFTVSTSGCGTNNLNFTDESTSITDSAIISWDFGDGRTANGPEPSHLYGAPGVYLVTQTVRDGSTCTDEFSRFVQIADVDLSLSSSQLFDGQDGTDSMGNQNGFADPGEQVEVRIQFTNAGSDSASGTLTRVTVTEPVFGVELLGDTMTFGPIAPGETVLADPDFLRLRVDPALPCGQRITLHFETSTFNSEGCASEDDLSFLVGLPALANDGQQRRVTTSGGDSQQASAAFGTTHDIFYTDDASGTRQVFLVRKGENGGAAFSPRQVSFGLDDANSPQAVYSSDSLELLTTWTQSGIIVARMTEQAQLLGARVTVGQINATEPDILLSNLGPVVAWSEEMGGATSIQVQRFTPNLSLLDSAWTLDQSESSELVHVRLALLGDTLLVTYLRNADGGSSLIVRTYSLSTRNLLSSRTITGALDDSPAALAFENRFLVAWGNEAGTLETIMLEANGTMVQRQDIGPGSQPALASKGLVATLVYMNASEVYGRGISRTGAPFGGNVPVSFGEGASVRPTVSVSGNTLALVAWEDLRSPHSNTPEIYTEVLERVADENCVILGLGDVAPLPDGDGVINVSDVIVLLRASVGLVPLTPELLARGDVAPGNREGTTHRIIGDGEINVGDVVVLLQASVGLVRLSPGN